MTIARIVCSVSFFASCWIQAEGGRVLSLRSYLFEYEACATPNWFLNTPIPLADKRSTLTTIPWRAVFRASPPEHPERDVCVEKLSTRSLLWYVLPTMKTMATHR